MHDTPSAISTRPTDKKNNVTKDKANDTPWKFFEKEDALQFVLACRHSMRTLVRCTPWFISHASMLDIALLADPDIASPRVTCSAQQTLDNQFDLFLFDEPT